MLARPSETGSGGGKHRTVAGSSSVSSSSRLARADVPASALQHGDARVSSSDENARRRSPHVRRPAASALRRLSRAASRRQMSLGSLARRPPPVRLPSGRGVSRRSCAERRSRPDRRSFAGAPFTRAPRCTFGRATSPISLGPRHPGKFSSFLAGIRDRSRRPDWNPSPAPLARRGGTVKLGAASEASSCPLARSSIRHASIPPPPRR